MCKKPLIVHLVQREKFTSSYINFMNEYMSDKWCHFFYTSYSVNEFPLELITEENVRILDDVGEFFYMKKDNSIIEKLSQADKIIISGVTYLRWRYYLLPKEIKEKIYLQFWGGDYTRFRRISFKHPLKWFIEKAYLREMIYDCAGIINLIDGEYSEMKNIFKINKKMHFVAPVPTNCIQRCDVLNSLPNNECCKVILGNSATRTNQHRKALDFLEHLKDEKLEVYCPLSYGNLNYRRRVIRYGKKKLGDKFIPIINFQPRNQYMNFLDTIDIGIYNNNRQQALGNINTMLLKGKKVYMRPDISMWKYYKKLGIKIFDINELKDISYDEFKDISVYDQEINNKLVQEKIYNLKVMMEKWQIILNT